MTVEVRNVKWVRRGLLLLAAGLVLSGCSKGVEGERVLGQAGSPMWVQTASAATQNQYFSGICQGYGFSAGTSEMAHCISQESRQARNEAVAYSNRMAVQNAAMNNGY